MSTPGNGQDFGHRDDDESGKPTDYRPSRSAGGTSAPEASIEKQPDQPTATAEPSPDTDTDTASEVRLTTGRLDSRDVVRDLPPDSADAIYRSQVSDPSDPGQRAAARGALVNAVRSTAGQMRRTAGRLDKLADRLSAVAVAQMETSQAEREFAAADHRHRARGPVQR